MLVWSAYFVLMLAGCWWGARRHTFTKPGAILLSLLLGAYLARVWLDGAIFGLPLLTSNELQEARTATGLRFAVRQELGWHTRFVAQWPDGRRTECLFADTQSLWWGRVRVEEAQHRGAIVVYSRVVARFAWTDGTSTKSASAPHATGALRVVMTGGKRAEETLPCVDFEP